jgi:putative ABC transport system permease protein
MFLLVWWRRLWLFLDRDRVRRELEEEMQLHRDLRARALERGGVAPVDAALAARRRFGHDVTLAERGQESWGFRRGDELRWNVRYALRRLANRSAYAATIVLVMGLGIGATTAMFSAVDAVMLRSLPFRDPGRLVSLTGVELPFASSQGKPADVRATIDLDDVAAMPELFSSVAAFAAGPLNLPDPDRPLRIRAGVVTDGFFRTLGVEPALGRTFAKEETVPGAGAVVVLSDGLWRRRYGARDMVGEAILLDDQRYQVIGVMAPGFSFPQQSDIWIPMSVPTTPATFAAFGGMLSWQVVARLAPGVEMGSANNRLLQRWERKLDGPDSRSGQREFRDEVLVGLRSGGTLEPLKGSLSGTRAKALLVLLGATTLLLLIACANVTNLLLSDAATRTREMALRTALGASRGRVFRQVLTESLILALGGIVTGLLLAPVILQALGTLMPPELAGVAAPKIDWRVLAFASSLGLVTGVGFGLWPARTASRTDPGETIKRSGNPLATGRRSSRTSRSLIVVEVALSLMLLVGSGLLLRSFANLMGVDRGMETANVASLELSFAGAMPNAVRLARIEAMLERLRRTQGVESAAVTNDLPLSDAAEPFRLGIVEPVPGGARYLPISPNYFGTLGISLRRGRDFTPRDDSLAPPAVIINETLARRQFPDVDPVGRQLTARAAPNTGRRTAYTVVGVVANARELDLSAEALPQLYFPMYQFTPTTFALVARGRGEPAALLAALQNAVRAVDASQALGRARMMDQVVRESVATERTNVLLISLFAGLALVLAALGVYAVVAHGVTQRGREFGIRTALGATGGNLLVMVSGEIFVVVALGIAIGLAGAWAGARVLDATVFGVAVHDPATFAIGAAVLAFVAMTAAVLPLRRVFRVNAVDVIRSE